MWRWSGGPTGIDCFALAVSSEPERCASGRVLSVENNLHRTVCGFSSACLLERTHKATLGITSTSSAAAASAAASLHHEHSHRQPIACNLVAIAASIRCERTDRDRDRACIFTYFVHSPEKRASSSRAKRIELHISVRTRSQPAN